MEVVVDKCHLARWWEAVEGLMRVDIGEVIAEVRSLRQRRAEMHFPIG